MVMIVGYSKSIKLAVIYTNTADKNIIPKAWIIPKDLITLK